MLVQPVIRNRVMTVLRRVAMTRGALPVRTWERSSSKETSRTQWRRFSMPQCPPVPLDPGGEGGGWSGQVIR